VQIAQGKPFPRSVSCTSETMCLAVAGGSNYRIFDGTGWTPPEPMRSAGVATADCVSSTLCVAVGTNTSQEVKAGDVHSNSFNGTTWSAAVLIEKSRGGFADISCPTASFCEAVDFHGFTLSRIDGQWSQPTRTDLRAGLAHVSCASASSCVAVDTFGYATTFDGSTWTKPTLADAARFASLSCPAASFCLGVDDNGDVTTFDGTSWTAPTPVEPDYYLRSVSCISTSYCVALAKTDQGFFVFTYDGSTWSQPVDLGSDGASGKVSCGSTTLCVVITDYNLVSTFDGTTWSAPQQIKSHWTMDAVSCGTICLLFGESGYAVTYSAHGWSKPVLIDPEGPLGAASCTKTRNCVAADYAGWAVSRSTGAAQS
jgi:hypothetical protein